MPITQDTDTFSLRIHGRYHQLQCIASGGIGHVYLGTDEQLQRRVAIKRLKSNLTEIQLPSDSAWQEAKALASLQHPNIVTLFDFGQDDYGPFFIMEFLDGETLDQRLQRGPLDQATFVEVARQALEGVNAAHQCGILHRDLKPSNFMLCPLPNGSINLKVLDFGLAKFQEAPSVQTSRQDGHILGSIYYIAPEQFEQQAVDVRSDLYSIGQVFYTCLAGHPAYRGETVYEILNQHMQGAPVRLEELRPDVDPALTGWVHRLIQRYPSHRFQDSAKALQALYEWVRGQTQGFLSSPSPTATPDFISRSKTPMLLGLLSVTALIVAAAVGLILTIQNKKSTTATSHPQVQATIQPHPTSTSTSSSLPLLKPDPYFDPRDLSRLRPLIGQTITLRGTPIALGKNRVGTITYLNFTPNYRDSVALVCFHQDDPVGFRKENLEALLQKPLQVTGRLEEHRGNLQIRITSLAMIQHSPSP